MESWASGTSSVSISREQAREVLDPVLASLLRLLSQHPLAVICTLCDAIFLIHK